MDSAASFLFDSVTKSTFVLAFAGAAIGLLAKRRSAACRHALFSAALLGAAAVPLLALALPKWHAGLLAAAPARAAKQSAALGADTVLEKTDERRTPDRGASAGPIEASEPEAGLPLSRLALAIWIAGAAVALSRTVVALARTRALDRAAIPITNSPALAALSHAARSLGVRRSVRLAESNRAATALTTGTLRPVVILPPSHREWTEDRLRAALLHELAHVQRNDCAVHLATRLASAILFFHPLARRAARRIDLLREQACDDAALAAGTRPTEYAAALLAAARDVRGARFALAMARPFPVEERLASVLDAARERRPLARRTPGRLAAAALATVATLTSLDPRSSGAAIQRFSPLGAASQTRWSDGRFHVGAFTRGEVRFSDDGERIESISPGGFLFLVARDGETGRLSTLLATLDDRGRLRSAWEGEPRGLAESVLLPETARRLRGGVGATPPRDRRISGSTLEGEIAVTTDGDERVVLARFDTERGPAAVFASGPISLSADGRSPEELGEGGFLALFTEKELPAMALVMPGAAGRPPDIGETERSILASALPAAWRATAGTARAMWRAD